METPKSTTLVHGWFFRIILLAVALAGFVQVAANTNHRLQVSTFGVPATIELFSKTQTPPEKWSNYENRQHASFLVKIKPESGSEVSSELFLSKEIVERLLNGGTAKIVFENGNPRRFRMQSDPLPPIGIGWLLFGLASLGLFLYSLKLR